MKLQTKIQIKPESSWLFYLTAFLASTILRAIPEFSLPKYPVGYDTVVYYAPEILQLSAVPPLELLSKAPLLYVLLWLVKEATKMDVYLMLKMAGPLLYGALATAFLLFLQRYLKWSLKKSLFATLVCFLHPTTLRISWDLFRNELGMLFFFLLIVVLAKKGKIRLCLSALMAIFVVLSHEFVSILVFLVVPWAARKQGWRWREILGFLAPAALLFLYQLVPIITAHTFTHPPATSRIIRLVKEPIPTDTLSDPRFSGSYIRLVDAVARLTVYHYLPLLPIIVLGFFREPLLDVMVGWLCFASYIVLVVPRAYPFYSYYRWLILLIYPLSVYVSNGLTHLIKHRSRSGKIAAYTFIALLLLNGLGYASGVGCYMLDPVVATYQPYHLVYSSIDPPQIENCISCIRWLNNHSCNSTVLLVEERFRGWAMVYLSEEISIAWYPAKYPLSQVPVEKLSRNFNNLYLLWLQDGRPYGFELVYEAGKIALYKYVGESAT